MPDNSKLPFTSEDLDLINVAFDLFPDLALVTYGAKLIRKHLQYPIKDIEALEPLFPKGKSIVVKGIKVSFKQLKQFTPKEIFPLEAERDFLCKMLIVAQIGQRSHFFDKEKDTTLFRFDSNITLLPAPAPIPFAAKQ